jgi:hypothetical protein
VGALPVGSLSPSRARFGEHRTHETIESLAELRNRGVCRSLLIGKRSADLREPSLNTIIHPHGMGEERTYTRCYFGVERARIRARNFDTSQFARIASFQMLAPQTRKLHTELPCGIVIIRGPLLPRWPRNCTVAIYCNQPAI